MLKLFKNKWIVVLFCLILSGMIAFVVIPGQISRQKATTEIVRVRNIVAVNSVINEGDIQMVEVGSYNLPDDVLKTKEEIVGKYANETIYPSDNIIPSMLKSDEELNNPYYQLHVNNQLAVSIMLKDLQQSVSAKLMSGDIVSVYTYNTASNTAALIPELKYVKVLSLTNNQGQDIETVETVDDYKTDTRIPATATLLVTPEQAGKLVAAENQGIIHLALAGRGKEAESLLGGGQ